MANLKKCSICGEEYAYCPNCANTRAWKFYTDTHEHYQILLIIQDFGVSQDKEKARLAFEKLGITADSDLSAFKPKIAERIKNLVTVEQEKSEDDKDKTTFKRTRRNKLYSDD